MARLIKIDSNPMYHRSVDVLDSENISVIKYNIDNGNMFVQFTTGAKYEYSNVDSHVFGAIIIADSVGVSFNSLITKNPDRYPFRKVI